MTLHNDHKAESIYPSICHEQYDWICWCAYFCLCSILMINPDTSLEASLALGLSWLQRPCTDCLHSSKSGGFHPATQKHMFIHSSNSIFDTCMWYTLDREGKKSPTKRNVQRLGQKMTKTSGYQHECHRVYERHLCGCQHKYSTKDNVYKLLKMSVDWS